MKHRVVRTAAGYTLNDLVSVSSPYAGIRGKFQHRNKTNTESLGRERWPVERAPCLAETVSRRINIKSDCVYSHLPSLREISINVVAYR